MKVNTTKEAWAEADKIFPTDYIKDDQASDNAGYPVYHSTCEGHEYDSICDLGDRLEVNVNGKSTNIWIEPEMVKDMGTMMKQKDYDKLSEDEGTKFMSDAEARLFIGEELGFQPNKVRIVNDVSTYYKDGCYARKYQTFSRKPCYNSTDWNYVRFDCCGWSYELVNGAVYLYAD